MSKQNTKLGTWVRIIIIIIIIILKHIWVGFRKVIYSPLFSPSSILPRLLARRFPQFFSPSSIRFLAVKKVKVAWPAALKDIFFCRGWPWPSTRMALCRPWPWPFASCIWERSGILASRRASSAGDSDAESSSWSDFAARRHADFCLHMGYHGMERQQVSNS